MSKADEEIFQVGGSADDEDDDDDDQEGGGVHHGRSGKDDGRKIIQRRTSYVDEFRCGGTKSFTKAKKVVLFPFTKVKKHLHHRRKSHKRQPSSSSSFGTDAAAVVIDAANESISGNTTKGNSGGVVDACVCFKQPQTLESSVDYQTSDPNDPTFTFDTLKDLIEKNDFYSKECNPHLDFHDISCCDHTIIG